MLTLNSILSDLSENRINQIVDANVVAGGKSHKSKSSKKSRSSKSSKKSKSGHGYGCCCGWG